MHGAGYWSWTEEELAAIAEKEAEYNALVEQGYTEEDIKAFYEMQEAAIKEGDFDDVVGAFDDLAGAFDDLAGAFEDLTGDIEDFADFIEVKEWHEGANWMEADYVPA